MLSDPLVRIHPNAIETYDVLNGEIEFFQPALRMENFFEPENHANLTW